MFLDSYFDESLGVGGDLVVAGYIGNAEVWTAFSSKWNEVLKRYKIPYFHMVEFNNRHSSLYKHLSRAEKMLLLTYLLRLIRAAAKGGVSCRINQGEYKLLTSPQHRELLGTAYAFAIQICAFAIDLSLSAIPGDDHVYNVLIEEGHVNARNAVEFLEREKASYVRPDASQFAPDYKFIHRSEPIRVRIGEVGLRTKRDHPALQAADILAYCTLTAQSKPFSAEVLRFLRSNLVHREIVLTKEVLEALTSFIVQVENKRLWENEKLHKASKMLGWFGGKFHRIPGGFLLDTTNFKVPDLAKVLESFKNDPSVEITFTLPDGSKMRQP